MALNPCPECGNMVSDTATNCPKCGYNLTLIKKDKQPLPPPNYMQPNTQPKKPMGCIKIGALVFGVILFIFLLGGIASECSGNSTETITETNNIASEPTDEKETKEELALKNLNRIEKEIASIKEGVDYSSFRGSVEQLQLELLLFSTWAKLIDEAKIYDQNKSKANELKKLVENIQKKEFPLIRKEYAKLSNGIMWEHDIEVTTSSNNTILNITGGVFAANKNIKEFQEKIQNAVKEYRFKQVRYRWYDGADKYTYYDMYDGNDTDLVIF